jgi:hypothetical protein
MYYPAANDIWKNTRINEISYNNNRDDSKTGWSDTPTWSSVVPSHYNFTAIAVSDSMPKHRVYVGASADRDNLPGTDEHPLLYRIDNAHNQNNSPVDVSIDTSLTPRGGYLHDIAINPNNADELIAVLSNYNVSSVFYTDDGGSNWTEIEGNLAADQEVAGPSVRSASILPTDNGTIYSVGTSAGLYTTGTLSGGTTEWVLEAPNLLGYSITEALDQRTGDDLIAAGTHGRGIFIGSAQGSVYVDPPTNEKPDEFVLKPNFPNPFNPTTNIGYNLPVDSRITLSVYDIQGRLVRTIINDQYQSAGSKQYEFNAEGLASGTYVYQLRAEPVSENGSAFYKSRKMLLVK